MPGIGGDGRKKGELRLASVFAKCRMRAGNEAKQIAATLREYGEWPEEEPTDWSSLAKNQPHQSQTSSRFRSCLIQSYSKLLGIAWLPQ